MKSIVNPVLILFLMSITSACQHNPDTKKFEKVQVFMEQRAIDKLLYINGNTCLPCIQPEIMRLKLDTTTWVVLHPKLEFLESTFAPKVWVDWDREFSADQVDTMYFHYFENSNSFTHKSGLTQKEII